MNRMDFLQAENQLKTFAQMRGGFAWFPQFDGELPGIMREVAAFLRHQYSISYTPSNQNQDGKFRKIKVELVAPDGEGRWWLRIKRERDRRLWCIREKAISR